MKVVDRISPSFSGLQFLYLFIGRLGLIISKLFLPLKFSSSRMEAEVGVLRLAEDPHLWALYS